ncbi:MAG TPA: cation transporter [Haliscomenobacter sp.]|uniref:heavy-metal-associated domain-containing protein n=1 Tax=Haliscomenobacter sp. TaxID=2717303 RepID=UPI002B75AABF|nr:MauE/DoxX family redox-associated membrane protein [Haliscomenobacter sp.]HOY17625.1 cation transporter [Haliscomenobacter sp.]HPH18999.1 cation transporter [Haliscomenobacter sp.]
MTHQYQLEGLTCDGCVAKVKSLLSTIAGIESVGINAQRNEATISMTQHVSTETLQAALKDYPKYTIVDKINVVRLPSVEAESEKPWLETYKPILLIFGYITLVTLLIQLGNDRFDAMQWMQHFMAGFFLVFSFFKLLNLTGFAESYQMYDVIARRFPAWGYVYAFTELGLGLAYLTNFQPQVTNVLTFVVMSLSIIGVLQSVLNKRRIQCACLGATFNLPMSTVTIIEDGLMIAMSAGMILMTL